jgi:hypothetical protein
MKPLTDWQFDASRPLQTKRGTAQALRCGADKIDGLIERGILETVNIGRSVRVTTKSILEVASTGDQQSTEAAA